MDIEKEMPEQKGLDENGLPPGVLTKWENQPTIRDLKQDLADGRIVHNAQETKIDGYLDALLVRNKSVPKTLPGNSQVQPKLIRKQAEWRYAALSEPYLSTDDVFKVEPVTWEDRDAAKQNQLVLNNQFNTKLKKVRFIDALIRTAVDEGTAIVQVGWEFVEEEYQVEVPDVQFVVDPSFAETIQWAQQLQTESPSEFQTNIPDELKQALQMSMEQQVPIRPEIIGSHMETRTRTVRNAPTAEILPYQNIIIDPTCEGDIDKAGFAIRSFDTSMSMLKKDGKYKNLEYINVDNVGPLNEPDHNSGDFQQNFQFKDNPRKKIVVYEYWGFWDIHGNGTVEPIVAAWCGNVLIRMELNPYPDKKLPFVILQYLPVRRHIHGEPDGVLIEDNQKIAGAVTRGMIDMMAKSANGQTGMRKDMLDATNKRKYENGQDYEFNGNVDPRQGVYMHTFGEIPQSAPMMLQMQNMEAESLTGVKSFSQGVSGNSLGDVAAGVRGAMDAASKRELGILRRISAALCEIGRKFISMNSVFLEEQEVIRITNEEFVTVHRDDLDGSFDLKLGVSTAEEDERKAQELAFMLQTMGNNMDADMSRMILSDIARLRKMPDLAKKIEKFQPQPDPLAIKMQELQIALLEAQVQTEYAKAASFGAQAQLNGVKVGTEQAKAKDLSSTADKKDLEFVEQESGVTQERDLQKQGAQAEAQSKLLIAKHYMTMREKAMDKTSK